MPAVPPPTSHPTWKQAWDAALYGAGRVLPAGVAGRALPDLGARLAAVRAALVRLTREAGLDTVVDIGAGRGELLTAMHRWTRGSTCSGSRWPPGRPGWTRPIAWTTALPESVEGLVVANEWLDNIPCHVVEVDDRRRGPRVVHVDPATGEESLGQPLTALHRCRRRWAPGWTGGGRWTRREPGARAEVGTTRDAAWADVVARVRRGIAVAVDYGHTARGPAAVRLAALLPRRPRGRRAPRRVARRHRARRGRRRRRAGGGGVRRQRDALRELGVDGTRPDLELATDDAGAYVGAWHRERGGRADRHRSRRLLVDRDDQGLRLRLQPRLDVAAGRPRRYVVTARA